MVITLGAHLNVFIRVVMSLCVFHYVLYPIGYRFREKTEVIATRIVQCGTEAEKDKESEGSFKLFLV